MVEICGMPCLAGSALIAGSTTAAAFFPMFTCYMTMMILYIYFIYIYIYINILTIYIIGGAYYIYIIYK
jgi:hypothetical protein